MTVIHSLFWMIAFAGSSLIYPHALAWGEDVKGSSDHPLVSRYAGSTIIRYKQDAFDQYRLFVKKAKRYGGVDKNLDSTMSIEGKVTRITYEIPSERSTIEVSRNYDSALKTNGFEILFSCSHEACGGRNFNHAVIPYSRDFAENYGDQRYLAAKLKRQEGDIFVLLYVVRNTANFGRKHNMIFAQLDVVELQAMEGNMVTIDASAMSREIAKTGRVALYGIYFDTGKSEIKPESQATLDEISKLLKNNPSLELVVVGHTDNQGSSDYNMDLSKRRAQAVVDKLVRDYGIENGRLQYWGVGFLSPVASNRSEEGRQKNRRVELVEK